MATGVLVAESLRVGAELSGVPLRVTRVRRDEVASAVGDQPERWTLLDFEVPDGDATALAEALAGVLEPVGGWYTDFHTTAEAFVVFADRVFRYPRGDAAQRARVETYARSVGVPDAQLDWAD